jgi:hypothetical protein
MPNVAQRNAQTIAGMNRKNRRQAERLMAKGYDDERISSELVKFTRQEQRYGKIVKLWRRMISRLGRETYYTHIPKQIRPMVCTGYKEGVPIMVADHIKCAKIRRKGANA